MVFKGKIKRTVAQKCYHSFFIWENLQPKKTTAGLKNKCSLLEEVKPAASCDLDVWRLAPRHRKKDI
jgi:hypothetical protein